MHVAGLDRVVVLRSHLAAVRALDRSAGHLHLRPIQQHLGDESRFPSFPFRCSCSCRSTAHAAAAAQQLEHISPLITLSLRDLRHVLDCVVDIERRRRVEVVGVVDDGDERRRRGRGGGHDDGVGVVFFFALLSCDMPMAYAIYFYG